MRRSRIFIVLFFSLFVAMLGAGVIAPVMPLYGQILGASGFGLGMIFSAFSVSRVLFMPLAGKLSDSRGRKNFIIAGLSIYALASLGYVWSHSVFQLLAIRFLHGIGSAMVVPIASAAIGDRVPRGSEGSIMGSFNVALFLGYGCGPLLGGWVMRGLGLDSVFFIMGGLSLVSILSVVFFMPREESGKAAGKKAFSSFPLLWASRVFRGLMTFRFSNAVVRGTLTAFLPILASGLGIDPGRIGFLVSLNIILTAVFQHLFGGLADRLNRVFLIVGGNVLTAIPMLLVPAADSFSQLVILSIIMGTGAGFAFPAALAVATEMGRDHGMGNIMGYFNQSMSLGMILGPVIAGWILDLTGMSCVFLFGGVLCLLGSGLTVFWMTNSAAGKTKHEELNADV